MSKGRIKLLFVLLGLFFQIHSATWYPIVQGKSEGSLAEVKSFEGDNEITLILENSGVFIDTLYNEADQYQYITVPGFDVSSVSAGDPAIPTKTVMFKIPFGVTVDVSTVVNQLVEFSGIEMYPRQTLPVDTYDSEFNNPPFVKNQSRYNMNEVFPVEPVISYSLHTLRDHQLVSLTISPIAVNPVTKIITVSDLHITISLIEPSLESRINDENIPPRSSRSNNKILPQEYLGDTVQYSRAAFDNYWPERYMIIADDQFKDNPLLADFIDWKKRKGYYVDLVLTSDINSNGAPTNTEIKDFMQSLLSSEYPSYLLLIGDETSDNGVAGNMYVTSMGGYSDLKYSLRRDDDFLPDLFYGRIPAENNDQLTVMLKKVLFMDRTPHLKNHYDKALFAGMLQDGEYLYSSLFKKWMWTSNHVADRLFCETLDAIASFYETKSTFSSTRALVNPGGGATESCTWYTDAGKESILWNPSTPIGARVANMFVENSVAKSIIDQKLREGVSLVLHRDHGDFNGWGDPEYDNENVYEINSENYPLVLSINCRTGGYLRHNSFANAWLFDHEETTLKPYGAYAFIGAIDNSQSWYNDYMAHAMMMGLNGDYQTFIDGFAHKSLPDPSIYDWPSVEWGLGEGSVTKLGPLLHYGKMYQFQIYGDAEGTNTENQFNIYNLYGDPEAEVVIHTPVALTVTHPANITGENSETITISAGEEGLLVSLYSSKLRYHAATTTDASGNAVFEIPPYDEIGHVAVTVTGYGKIPYEGDIRVGGEASLEEVLQFSTSGTWTKISGNGTLEYVNAQSNSGDKNLKVTVNSSEPVTLEANKIVDTYVGSNVEQVVCGVKLSFPEIPVNAATGTYRGNIQLLGGRPNSWISWIGQFEINDVLVSVYKEGDRCYADYEFYLPLEAVQNLRNAGLRIQLRLSSMNTGEWVILEELRFTNGEVLSQKVLSESLQKIATANNVSLDVINNSIISYDSYVSNGVPTSWYGIVYRDVWTRTNGVNWEIARNYFRLLQDVDRPMYLVERWSVLPGYEPESPTGLYGYWRQCWTYLGKD